MNYYGISGCGFMLLLCVAILWLSEREAQLLKWIEEREARVKLFIFDVKTCLRCINNGEDL
jgi:hypothetical protein